jgi:hypothetical protein
MNLYFVVVVSAVDDRDRLVGKSVSIRVSTPPPLVLRLAMVSSNCLSDITESITFEKFHKSIINTRNK